ncbi:uncharacterized protein LOC142972442 isoform X1 [Anticarsia gemmatalis]|uniref:uncharacterized protein LOC142972442 isoform X1 n=1 Tax=Anticarsia gemmatalis TaxID=129554 RepID=UPI003F75B0AC
MAGLLLLVVLQIVWSLGQTEAFASSAGGGAFAYTDSSGKKYSGTYSTKDGKVVQSSGDPVPFADTAFPGYGYGYANPYDFGYQGDSFYPSYFSNLENLLQEVFHSNLENQRLAYNAARKAFDISSNQAGYYENFASRLPQPQFNDFGGFAGGYGGGYGGGFGGFPNFNNFAFGMPNFPNSAFAGAAAGPGFRHQVAAINPANPNSPNVNRISHYSDTNQGNPGGYYAVSSKSYASSSNVNGQPISHRGSETVVNDNGKVTKYKVQD